MLNHIGSGTTLCSGGTRMLDEVSAIKYFHFIELHINNCLMANRKYLTAASESMVNGTDASGFSF